MAAEGNGSAGRRMDLNLYLGPPRSPCPRSLDLGSDLALSSLSLPSSTTATPADSHPSAAMSGSVEPLDSHPPYSPSHAEYTPELPSVLHNDCITTAPEYTPYSPYDPYGSSSAFSPVRPVSLETEGHYTPYSPSRVQPLPAIQEMEEATVMEASSHVPYDHVSSTMLTTEPSGYSPPYVSGTTAPQEDEGATFSFCPSVANQTGESSIPDGGSSFRPLSPDSGFRQLIEASHRWPRRRFRSSLSRAVERVTASSLSSSNIEHAVHDALGSPRPSDCHGKHKVMAEDNVADISEVEGEEKSRNTANFECNICLDMATEPVVTSCGHLFCWPCLYQWLHVHSDHKECPVCKGEVTESNITPIYGRGSSQSTAEKTSREDQESGLKIPPRPHGNRLESFRQQFRPISRRFGQGFSSWRQLYDRHVHGNRYEALTDRELQEVLEGDRRILSRLRARRLQMDANPESGSVAVELGSRASAMRNPMDNTNASSIFQDGIDIWHRLSLYGLGTERLVAVAADLGRVVGQLASSSNAHGASTSSVDSPNPEPSMGEPNVGAALAAEQASASSTMAVIQGDTVNSDALGEPNSGGSSRPDRRRGRSSSSSFDTDGGSLHARKRRRLN